MLDIIREIEHPHIIAAIASYTRGPERCFIFPWAEGGNLREFWMTHNQDTRDANLITWIIEQLYGLFDGLKKLHYFDEKRNCRHGDLKPENILLFRKTALHEIPKWGRLVVADLGLTKFHSEATRQRVQPTASLTGTQKYEPPETEVERGEAGQPRSRLYDMWSMGCVVLECIIWLLYRIEGLESFNMQLDKFWQIRNDNRRVHPTVERWIGFMMEDPRCQKGTAIRELLGLVRDRLLVVKIKVLDPGYVKSADSECRAYAKELEKRLGNIVERLKMPGYPDYLCNAEIWERNKYARGPRGLPPMDGGLLTVVQPAVATLHHSMSSSTSEETSDRNYPNVQIEDVDETHHTGGAEEVSPLIF